MRLKKADKFFLFLAILFSEWAKIFKVCVVIKASLTLLLQFWFDWLQLLLFYIIEKRCIFN